MLLDVHLHNRFEIAEKKVRFVTLDFAVLHGSVIEERVQLDRLVRDGAILILLCTTGGAAQVGSQQQQHVISYNVL